MGIGIKMSVPVIGSVSAQYVPKADGQENADKNASGTEMLTNYKGQDLKLLQKQL